MYVNGATYHNYRSLAITNKIPKTNQISLAPASASVSKQSWDIIPLVSYVYMIIDNW